VSQVPTGAWLDSFSFAAGASGVPAGAARVDPARPRSSQGWRHAGSGRVDASGAARQEGAPADGSRGGAGPEPREER